MKIRILAALLLGLVAAAPSFAATKPVADRIKQLEDEVNAAYIANDLPKYFSYYADDLRALFPDGPTTLPEYKKSWTEFIKGGGGIESFTYSDLHVQVGPSGDTAVASYSAAVRTRTPGKGSADEKYNETDVWFKRAGKWKIVEIHYSAAGGEPN